MKYIYNTDNYFCVYILYTTQCIQCYSIVVKHSKVGTCVCSMQGLPSKTESVKLQDETTKLVHNKSAHLTQNLEYKCKFFKRKYHIMIKKERIMFKNKKYTI